MKKDKKGNVVYTLKISFNPDTDEIDYIAEGMDDDFNFTPFQPFNLDHAIVNVMTSEDMEAIKGLYEIEED